MATELENLVPEADVEVEGMRGPKGDKGDSYVLTEADKEEIARKVDTIIDAETDKTLSISGKPADAKAAGDKINNLKADLSFTEYGNINVLNNAFLNKYITATGTEASYNGWKATDYLDISQYEKVFIYTEVASAYNAAYKEDKSFSFPVSLTVGMNEFAPPTNVKYLRLSNTNGGMDGTILYGIVKSSSEINKSKVNELYEKSDNFVLDSSAFWLQGNWDNEALTYAVHSVPVIPTKQSLLYLGGIRIGTPLSDTFCFSIKCFDSSDNLVYSLSPITIGELWTVASNSILIVNPNVAYFVVQVTTNAASKRVTPQTIVNNYKFYIGYTNISSYSEWYDGIVPKVSVLNKKVNPLLEDQIPNYWESYMNSKVSALRDLDGTVGTHGFSFVFITDVHWQNNFKNSPKLIKYILDNTSVDTVIFGGDVLTKNDSISSAMDVINDWGNKTNKLGTVNVFGNHDNNSNGGNDATLWIGYDRWYGTLLKPIEQKVTWSENKKYFYMDNLAQKVRMIFLNTGYDQGTGLDNTQASWLQQLLYNLESGWKAIVFTHLFFLPATVESGTTTLSLLGSGTLAKQMIDSQYSSMESHGADFVGVITGHVHRDYSLISDSGYPIIGTTCDANGLQASLYDPVNTTRTSGTTTEQAFDVYHIDTENRKIYVTRIGAGTDREFTY